MTHPVDNPGGGGGLHPFGKYVGEKSGALGFKRNKNTILEGFRKVKFPLLYVENNRMACHGDDGKNVLKVNQLGDFISIFICFIIYSQQLLSFY